LLLAAEPFLKERCWKVPIPKSIFEEALNSMVGGSGLTDKQAKPAAAARKAITGSEVYFDWETHNQEAWKQLQCLAYTDAGAMDIKRNQKELGDSSQRGKARNKYWMVTKQSLLRGTVSLTAP
jgi:hypothetical protein